MNIEPEVRNSEGDMQILSEPNIFGEDIETSNRNSKNIIRVMPMETDEDPKKDLALSHKGSDRDNFHEKNKSCRKKICIKDRRTIMDKYLKQMIR